MTNLKPALGTATVTAIASAPAYAQFVGSALGSPTQMATNIAAAMLAAGAATSVIAGGIKAYQVWAGGRNPYEAGKYLILGMGLLFGTAAVVGFG